MCLCLYTYTNNKAYYGYNFDFSSWGKQLLEEKKKLNSCLLLLLYFNVTTYGTKVSDVCTKMCKFEYKVFIYALPLVYCNNGPLLPFPPPSPPP